MAIGSAMAQMPSYSTKNFTLNLGVGFPSGDMKDAGVSTTFMGGLDYSLGMLGDGSNAESFVGLGAIFGNGDNGFKSTSYGIHYGVKFGLGNANANMPLTIKLRGGYYNTKVEAEVVEAATESSNKWGFAFTAAVEWKAPATSGSGFSIEAGTYFLQEVRDVRGTGYYIMLGIPLGGK